MRIIVVLAAVLFQAIPVPVRADEAEALRPAQMMFYNGRYADASAATADLCRADVAALAACELRTSAILFQLRRAIGDTPDKEKAFKQCEACGALLDTFVEGIRQSQAVARAHLKTHPGDEDALFFLGKQDLNYVWLQLGTLGRRTGLEEYREARRSLDAVLKRNPEHVRAKVARAWIDYIVDTKMPFGTKWLLGGGNKKRGLQAVRDAAAMDADLFIRTEAVFALWDMQVREKNMAGAVQTARRLAADFPENADVRTFLDTHALTTVAARP